MLERSAIRKRYPLDPREAVPRVKAQELVQVLALS